MNEENQWNGPVDADKMEGLVEPFVLEDVSKALGRLKNGRPTEISKQHLTTSQHGKQAILEIANGILNSKYIPLEWCIVIPFYKKKVVLWSVVVIRGVQLLENGMKVLERLLEKRLRKVVKVDEIHFI